MYSRAVGHRTTGAVTAVLMIGALVFLQPPISLSTARRPTAEGIQDACALVLPSGSTEQDYEAARRLFEIATRIRQLTDSARVISDEALCMQPWP